MAGRKDKYTVNYFPHYVVPGKTIFILENTFGNNGYTIWYKTLEILGASENHYIDLRNEANMLFIVSKLRTTIQELNKIYDLLSKLDAIDAYLWSEKIIFSQKFIDNIEDAYKRRNNKCWNKLDICKHLLNLSEHKYKEFEQKYTEYIKVNKSKEKESKENKIPTLNSVIEYFLKKEKSKKDAEYFYNYYEVSNWLDKNDNTFNWKQKALSWINSEKGKETKKEVEEIYYDRNGL